jgi:chromosome segregation protein
VLRGPHLVCGGAKAESRGILATKREIKELRERTADGRIELARMSEDAARLEFAIAQSTSALTALTAEQHRQDVTIVAQQAQMARAAEDGGRLSRKADMIALERRQAEEERTALDTRYSEAEASIGVLVDQQRGAEARLTDAQRTLAAARDAVDDLSMIAADARAAHAAMVERTAALEAEVVRLDEAARDVEQRIGIRAGELEQARNRRETLLQAVAEDTRTLDADVQALDALRTDVRVADEAASTVRGAVDGQDAVIREGRRALDEIRAHAAELDLARVTAQGDVAHLAQMCAETAQCSLEQVVVEVEAMERAGETTPDAAAITAEETDPEAEEAEASALSDPDRQVSGFSQTDESRVSEPPASMTAEEAINALKAKIDRLGPVNMMAIEQFDELETRHVFLTTQRKDLVDSIAQTAEAITRIDETTKVRFNEAFAAIQQNFQVTFSTLFGGGRAGLTLIDENDPLESGIDIVASPPGKRLQSVQLLSGGEKALTAIALMFAIFRYKPSPFCLLDEIDAPLDDANVGRFVEMLRGMLDRTQFILITHNRRTMEIANRLYGVTMEEPGVSKLISVQLN